MGQIKSEELIIVQEIVRVSNAWETVESMDLSDTWCIKFRNVDGDMFILNDAASKFSITVCEDGLDSENVLIQTDVFKKLRNVLLTSVLCDAL